MSSIHQSDVLIVVPFDEIFVNEQGAIMEICKQHLKILNDADIIYPSQEFNVWELKIFKFPKIQKILRKRYYKKIVSLCENFNKVYIHNDLYLLEYIFQKKLNKKIIFHLHNDINDRAVPILKSCDTVFVCSEFLKYRLLQFNIKSIVLPNTIPQIKRMTGQKRVYDALFVGRFDENKGFIDFLEIMIRNRKNKFAVIQASTPTAIYKYKMFIFLFICRLLCNIRFYRSLSREEVFRLMEISKLLVVPTRYTEAFGNVALEGLAADCLVVTSKIGGLKDIDIFDSISIDDLKVNLNGSLSQLGEISEAKKSQIEHILSQFSEQNLRFKLRRHVQ